MGTSNYLESAQTAWLQGTTYPAAPATLYWALYTSDPTDANTGTEVTGGSYARVAKTANATNFPATDGVVTNGTEILWPTASGSWGTPTHAGLLTASTGGNLLYHGPLTTVQPVVSGDVVKAVIGELILTIT